MEATAALTELTGLAAVPGRATVLAGQIRAALHDSTADKHRELFLAALLMLRDQQHGRVPDAAFGRLWDACGDLVDHYGIESLDDLRALETGGSACNA